MDISAPTQRLDKDLCQHTAAGDAYVPIQADDTRSRHDSMLHINLIAPPTRLAFLPSIREAYKQSIISREKKGFAGRDTVPVYCRTLKDYVPADTSTETYFRDVLGGQLCDAFPDLSYIFGNTRNPVTPLLRAAGGVYPSLDDIESSSAGPSATSTYGGASVRNYLYMVVMQAWLCANNQFVQNREFAHPRFLTPLALSDLQEATKARVKAAAAAAAAAATTPTNHPDALSTWTPDQRAFYVGLDSIEKGIFWKSYTKRGQALAALATSMTLHEFLLAVQCKFFVPFISRTERENLLKNMYTNATGMRFRLCEMPDFVDYANEAIQDKVDMDLKDRPQAKKVLKQNRGDITRRSSEKLGQNKHTVLTYARLNRNPSNDATYTLFPKQVQGRTPNPPYFLTHAHFGPLHPIMALGEDRKLHAVEAVWSIARYLNTNDRDRLQAAVRHRMGRAALSAAAAAAASSSAAVAAAAAATAAAINTKVYFCAENEPDSVKIKGPHVLYLAIPSDGNSPPMFMIHPNVVYKTQNVVAVVTPQPPQPRPKAAAAAAAAAAADPPTRGAKRKAPAGDHHDAYSITTTTAADEPMPCSPYASVFSPSVMSYDLIKWHNATSRNARTIDYNNPKIRQMMASYRVRTNHPWLRGGEYRTFLDKFFRASLMIGRVASESAAWDVLLHATAALELDQTGQLDWADRDAWIPRVLRILNDQHANDHLVYKARRTTALQLAGYLPGTDDDAVLDELNRAFSFEGGRNTSSVADTTGINQRFNARFFTRDRLIEFLRKTEFCLEIDGRPTPDSTVDDLVGLIHTAVTTGVRLVSPILDSHIAPCSARWKGFTTPVVGYAIPAAVLSHWSNAVKFPLFFHAAYISNPPVGPCLPGGSEWVRPRCTPISVPDSSATTASVLTTPAGDPLMFDGGVAVTMVTPSEAAAASAVAVPQIDGLRNAMMNKSMAAVNATGFAKVWMTIDRREDLSNMLYIGGDFALLHATKTKLAELRAQKMADRRNLIRLENLYRLQVQRVPEQIRAIADLCGLDLRAVIQGHTTPTASPMPDYVSTPQSWKQRLRRVMSHPGLCTPPAIIGVFTAAMDTVSEDELSRLPMAVGHHMADLVSDEKMTRVNTFDTFVRTYLSPPNYATIAQQAGVQYCLYSPDAMQDQEKKLCYDIVLHCFSKLKVKHVTSRPMQQHAAAAAAAACADADMTGSVAAAAAAAGDSTAVVVASAAAAAAASSSAVPDFTGPYPDVPSVGYECLGDAARDMPLPSALEVEDVAVTAAAAAAAAAALNLQHDRITNSFLV